jgi:hypothetical protein
MARREDTSATEASTAAAVVGPRLHGTGRTGVCLGESVWSVQLLGAAAAPAGQVVRQASVTESRRLVGEAGSEQIGRAARSHNLLEQHVDSI